ncbi:MAG: acyl-CoA dehydrogenase [Planctomycetia bacterium]|nr:acyl-CoA dehydrogenase [Planctomycetia bacterium]
MSDAQPRTGGRFLIDAIGTSPIFSRENFSDEHKEIEQMIREFAIERIGENATEINKFNKDLSLSILHEMGELGLLGIDVPEKYGGMEMDKITTAIAAESLSAGFCPSFTAIWSVQTGIGSLPIVWFGTPEQKAKYLPKIVTAEYVGAYGLTEPSAGSDALAGRTTAMLTNDGKHYILNGEKIFITNGGWADVFTVFAKVGGDKFSAFIIERNTPGFEIGPEEHKMGMKGSSTTPLIFKDAKVPVENLLYEVGKGATIAFNALNMGRYKLAASDLGGCKMVITEAVKYALERRQFGQPIAHFDAIKGKFADMIIGTYSSDCMIYRTIGLIQDEINTIDKNTKNYYIKVGEAMERYAIETSMAKVYGSEIFGKVTDHGIQILGGYGFIEDYPFAGAYRDTRIDRIWEGSNEINRMIITGYMMKKALLEELPIRERIQQIETYLATDPNGKDKTEGELDHEIQMLEAGKMLGLYLFHDALCEYGQDLKHEQQLTEILANIFIDIYTMESTISRVRQNIESGNNERTALYIAKVFAAEASIRLLNMALTGMNGIYKGNLKNSIIDNLKNFQVRMLPKIDIIGMKRMIAEHVYSKQSYPF